MPSEAELALQRKFDLLRKKKARPARGRLARAARSSQGRTRL
jgi:hypothetical protein